MLEVGKPAPEFRAKAYFSASKEIRTISLSDYRGKWVILTFHPADFTFVCATDIEGLAKYYEKFKENNAEVLAISTDSIFSHKVWAETSPRLKKSNIPLVEDIKKEISRAYGFLDETTGITRRGTVIINPEGKVEYISVHNDRLGKDVEHIYNSFIGLKYLYEHPPTLEGFDIIPAGWRPGEPTLKVKLPDDIGKF
ncbi:MAG TPA: peroxiredoxin [Thermofilum sp.]|nr:peroxiredoxin [Thermofilum sp.]